MSSGIKGSTSTNKRIGKAWSQPVWHMFLLCGQLFLLCGSKTSAMSLLQKHLLQKQLLLLTMELSAGHVIKYYKRVLAIRYVAVGIKKLLKTDKFEIIVLAWWLIGSFGAFRVAFQSSHHLCTLISIEFI